MSTNTRRVAADKRKRTETSCDVCKSRKQKCDRPSDQAACRYCVAAGLQCTTFRPRKQRLYGSVEGLSVRIRLLEALAKGLVPEAELAGNDQLERLVSSLGIPVPKDISNGTVAAHATRQDEAITEEMPLVPDQQGQAQYTGPSSSFAFHLKLRNVFSGYDRREFELFGPNAAVAADSHEPSRMEAGYACPTFPNGFISAAIDSPGDVASITTEREALDRLVDGFFEHVHADYPVLHEPSFRASYEAWSKDRSSADRVWLCTLLGVLLVAAPTSSPPLGRAQSAEWWRQCQSLIPSVLFASSTAAVQALMLLALYLHHNRHRDAAWNLTGAAIRIAYGIGLHRQDLGNQETRLSRELRKTVWWQLFAFEQLQISSYDRPSAIDPSQTRVSHADERVLGVGAYHPPGYSERLNTLNALLCSICQARKLQGSVNTSQGVFGPLSPAVKAFRDMARWRDDLPPHLRVETVSSSAPCFVRPILLLETQYHYNIIVLTRSALLHFATLMAQGREVPVSDSLLSMAGACRASGMALGETLLSLHDRGVFNAIAGFDMFYAITATLALILDIICATKQHDDCSKSTALLDDLSAIARQHIDRGKLPGTLQKWASLVTELAAMSANFCASCSTRTAQHPDPVHEAQLLMGLRNSSSRQGPASRSDPALIFQAVEARAPAPPQQSNSSIYDSYLAENMAEWQREDIEALLNS